MKFKIGDKTHIIGNPKWKNLITGINGSNYEITISPDSGQPHFGYIQDSHSYHQNFELDKEYLWNKQLKELLDEK